MPPTAEIAVEAAAFRRNRRRDKGVRTVTKDPSRCPKDAEHAGEFRRLCDRFVTVDKRGSAEPDTPVSSYQAPVKRVHGPNRTPAGKASCSISISPTVSDVTRPTRRPPASTTATAGADFS